MRKLNQAEKVRLVQKLAAAKRTAGPGGAAGMQRARPRLEVIHACGDHNHDHGLLTIDADELEENN